MTAIIMTMVILKRDRDLKRIKNMGQWIYICGRRKTGKTFMVKRFLDYDSYFFVNRDRTLFTENGRRISYETFFELFREFLGKKRVVIDEMHRLPNEFFDFLHLTGREGELIAISSTLWLSQKLLGSGSPILGLFSMYILGLADPRDVLSSLPGEDPVEDLKAAVYLREPILAPDYQPPIEDYLSTYLYGNRLAVNEIIGEIFSEERRRISQVYLGILRAISGGKRKSGEISSFLFSRGLIPKDNPGAIQKHLEVLLRMGLIEKIESSRRGFYYTHRSPLFNIHFYLDEKYGYVETDIPKRYIEEVVREVLPGEIERFVWDLISREMGLKKVKIEEPEIDIALKRFNRVVLVGEVKWREKVTQGQIREIEERLSRFNAKRVIVVPDKSELISPEDTVLLDARDLIEICRGSSEVLKETSVYPRGR